jgi:aminoglycoside phosphotransferase (APT) family kinase protein
VDDFDDGWDMSARLVDGRWVERSPRDASFAPQARRETQFLPWLAPQLPLPIPIPMIVSEEPLVLRHAYLPGARCPGTSPAHGRAVGRFLTALHAVDSEAAVAHGLQDAGSAYAAGQQIRDRLEALVLPILPTHLQPRGQALLARLGDLATDPCPVHGDLGLDHIRVTGESVTGVIDWGDSCVGDPALDLSATVLNAGPGFAGGVKETYRPTSELLKRAGDWHKLSPWHEVLFGLDTRDDRLVESGLREAIARLSTERP